MAGNPRKSSCKGDINPMIFNQWCNLTWHQPGQPPVNPSFNSPMLGYLCITMRHGSLFSFHLAAFLLCDKLYSGHDFVSLSHIHLFPDQTNGLAVWYGISFLCGTTKARRPTLKGILRAHLLLPEPHERVSWRSFSDFAAPKCFIYHTSKFLHKLLPSPWPLPPYCHPNSFSLRHRRIHHFDWCTSAG